MTALFSIGCSSKTQQPPPGETGEYAQPQPAAQPQPQQPGQGNPLGQMLGALGAMGQAAQGQQQQAPVQTVPWQNLAQALPVSAPGWTAANQATGESVQAMGIMVSQTKTSLSQGSMRAEVEIIDTSMNPLVAMPFNMARTMKIDSSEERMGPINFGTYPGTQRFDKKSGSAEVMAMVNNRIMITVKVSGATSEAAAVGLAQYVNFNHLSALTGT